LLEHPEANRVAIAPQSDKEIIILVCLEGQAMTRAYGKRDNILYPRDSIYFSSREEQAKLVLISQAQTKVAVITITVV